MDLQLATRRLGRWVLVTVTGEVDLDSASRLGEQALAATREASPYLLLDLSGVTFMDSTGVKVLLSVQRRAALAGGELALVAVSRRVHRLLELTGLTGTFRAYDALGEVPDVPEVPDGPEVPDVPEVAQTGGLDLRPADRRDPGRR